LVIFGAVVLWRFAPWNLLGSLHDPAAKPRQVTPSAGLLAEEQTFIDVYEKAQKSVVSITTLGIQRNQTSYDLEEVPEGAGSGFVWDEKGYIITNFHVVQNADGAQVTLWDGSTHKARVVGVAPDKDLAVLKITNNAPLQPIDIGSSSDLKVGQRVFAIGNPFGLGGTFTQGIISALHRTMKAVTGRPIDGVLQTSTAINPGNSGGPLLDSSGRLIGVTTAIYSPSGANAGIGFAIPVDTVNQVVPELIRRGKVERPGMGVQIGSTQIMRRLGIKNGVLIVEVLPGGAAAKAGLHGTKVDDQGKLVQLGDVLVAIDGKPLASASDLFDQMARHKVGDTVNLTVLRGGDKIDIPVTLEGI
jgi:S1-C subfamily serine protease